MNFWSIMLLFSAFQGVTLSAIILLGARGNKVPNRLLAVVILMVAMILAEYVLFSSGTYSKFRYVEFATTPLFFLIGPTLYMYVRSILEPWFRLSSRHLIHSVIFVFFVINYLPYYQLVGHRLLGWEAPSRTLFFDIGGYASMGAHIAFTAVYLYATTKLTRKHEFVAKGEESNSALIQYDWLAGFLTLFIRFLVLEAVALAGMVILEQHVMEVEYLMAAGLAAIVFYAGYHAIAHPEILSSHGPPDNPIRYRKSLLSPERATSYRDILVRHMERERPFLNPDLKLQDLSDQLSIPRNDLSQTLNIELGTTFFDFVNRYRVEEVKRRLGDPATQNLTILAIAFDSGFSSKASFNRVFRKQTGVTPSSFATRFSGKEATLSSQATDHRTVL